MDKVTKTDFIKIMATRNQTTQKQAETELDNVLGTLLDVTYDGIGVKFVGYFSTDVKKVPDRDFFNPQDRTKKVTIPAHNKIVIKPGAKLVEAAGESYYN